MAKENNFSDIFEINNDKSKQYDANQEDFAYHFNELIGDPLILEEVQKYFPRDKFETKEEALFFYKNHLGII